MSQRRSLTHVGGAVETAGDREIAAALANALDVPPREAPRRAQNGGEAGQDEADRTHVHGFHTYPARMHPITAARLVRLVSLEGGTLLDPFCGSGTVPVEAMIAGRKAVGTDLNPLAVRLARLKTSRLDPPTRVALVAAAEDAARFADARRKARAGASRRYGSEDVALFDPHVLLELDSLRMATASDASSHARDAAVRDALELVLSAILIKLSRKASDTSAAMGPRRIAAGFAARLFVRKTQELVRRMVELECLTPEGAPLPRIEIDDATRLRAVRASTVDGIVTSPPYVATYDYLAHHAARLRWLGLDAHTFAASEMGSRRKYARLNAAAASEAWSQELLSTLTAMARVVKKGGRVALVVADSAVGATAVRADAALASVARDAGFVLAARASQRRPHFHTPTADAFRDADRAEHATLLEKR